MKLTIKDCSIYVAIIINIFERQKIKHIITNGPHYIYHVDIWEIDKEISKKFNINII